MSVEQPFIFIAFAQEANELSENLTALLKKGEENELCRVQVECGANIAHLENLFENSDLLQQIDIFHYINNSYKNPDTLSFQKSDDDEKIAFIEYLVQIADLKFVVFEDLMNEEAAKAINQHAVPLVINVWSDGNEQPQQNADFSLYFYNILLESTYLKHAFNKASQKITSREGFENAQSKIHMRAGSKRLLNWRLAKVPENPVPVLEGDLELPEFPFPLLQAYGTKEVPLFFGREKATKNLFYLLHDQSTAPILLLYGESGVGKTSLVEAGLRPLLLNDHHVVLVDMPSKKGILTALQQATEHPEAMPVLEKEGISTDAGEIDLPELMPKDLPDFWELEEQAHQRPLVLVLDQAEHLFSKNEEQIQHFFEELNQTFNHQTPTGKLLLVCEKSHTADFEEQLLKQQLDYQKISLHPLRSGEIAEVVSGLSERTATRQAYNLQVESGLPTLLGNEIAKLPESERNFNLQILLARLWEKASEGQPNQPIFTVQLLKQSLQEGISISSFLQFQLEKLADWNTEAAQSGLALDVLMQYVVAGGTCSEQEIRDRYYHIESLANRLIWKLQELGLLVTDKDNPMLAQLSNPILAPAIQELYQKSWQPAQIATKVLESKATTLLQTSKPPFLLGNNELELIQDVRPQMRRLYPNEEKLIELSERHHRKRRSKRGRNSFFRGILMVSLFLAAVAGGLGWYTLYSEQSKIQNKQSNLKASFLAFISNNLFEEDATKALRVAEIACTNSPSHDARKALYQAYYNPQFYYLAHVRKNPLSISAASFAPSGKRMFVSWNDGTSKLLDQTGELISNVSTDKRAAQQATFLPDGSLILGGFEDGKLKIWDGQTGKDKHEFQAHNQAIRAVVGLKNGQFLTASDSIAKLWDDKGTEIAKFEGSRTSIQEILVSPDQTVMATLTADSLVGLWDMEGRLLNTYQANSISFSPNNKHLLTLAGDSAVIWDWENNEQVEVIPSVIFAKYAPSTEQLLYINKHEVAILKNNETATSDTLNLPHENIIGGDFSASAQKLFLIMETGKIRILDSEQRNLGFVHVTEPHSKLPQFSADGTTLFTQNSQNLHLWDCQVKAGFEWLGEDLNTQFSPNGKYFYTYSDTASRILVWNTENWQPFELQLEAAIDKVAFLPASTHLQVQTEDNMLYLWDFRINKKRSFNLAENSLEKVSFSDSATFALSHYNNKQVILSNHLGKQLKEYMVSTATFVPKSGNIITHDEQGIVFWTPQGDTIQHFAGKYSSWSISPDGSLLALSKDDNAFEIFRVDDAAKLYDFKLNKGRKGELIFSNDNEKIMGRKVSYNGDTNEYTYEWLGFKNIAAGTSMKFPPYVPSDMQTLEFTEDSKYVLAANENITKLIAFTGEDHSILKAGEPYYNQLQNMLVGRLEKHVKMQGLDTRYLELMAFRKEGLKRIELSNDGNWLLMQYSDKLEMYPHSQQKINEWLGKRSIYELDETDRTTYKLDEIQ